MQKKLLTKKLLREYIEITLGVFLMAVSIRWFFVYHGLVTGGVSGLAIIFYSEFNIPLWITNFGINIPLFLVSFKMMGLDIFIKSIYTTAMFTFALGIVVILPDIHQDIFISTIMGSVIVGAGASLIIKNNATSGGTLLIGRILEKISLGKIKVTTGIFIADFIVIVMGLYTFGVTATFYAIISIFIFTKVTDTLLTGAQNSKAMYVFSSIPDEITKKLQQKINRGITIINGRGVYSGKNIEIIMCVMNRKQLVEAKVVVTETDPKAFIVITSAHEVLGEGFSFTSS